MKTLIFSLIFTLAIPLWGMTPIPKEPVCSKFEFDPYEVPPGESNGFFVTATNDLEKRKEDFEKKWRKLAEVIREKIFWGNLQSLAAIELKIAGAKCPDYKDRLRAISLLIYAQLTKSMQVFNEFFTLLQEYIDKINSARTIEELDDFENEFKGKLVLINNKQADIMREVNKLCNEFEEILGRDCNDSAVGDTDHSFIK